MQEKAIAFNQNISLSQLLHWGSSKFILAEENHFVSRGYKSRGMLAGAAFTPPAPQPL